MTGLIIIAVFAVMLGFPGFYIITRKIFPKGSKKTAALICALLTAALVGLMFYLLATAPQSL
ncbi:hypothetical protein [Candidatus Avelusimicrobium aviculae]|uniref:hypothetical protein n=1 Tax=Candidatus Avelusimicrobium aviculae TaxID=3416206 RepID=UPI003D146214